jgi:hypothetical protein
MGISGRIELVLWNFKIWMYIQEHYPIVTQGLPVFQSSVSSERSTVIMYDYLLLLIYKMWEWPATLTFYMWWLRSCHVKYNVLYNTYIFLLIISVCERIWQPLGCSFRTIPVFLSLQWWHKIQLVFSEIQVNHHFICKGVKLLYGAAIFREI